MIAALALVPALAWASADQIARTDLVAKSKIRWSKADGATRVTVEIAGGVATRNNPSWSPQPLQLAFDLDKNRAVEREIKRAPLGSVGSESTLASERTLEILVEGASGWHPVARITLPLKTWRNRHAALYALLEPLLTVFPEQFETNKVPEK